MSRRLLLAVLLALLGLIPATPAGAMPPAAPQRAVIADGVSIGGVPVGGLTVGQAQMVVSKAYLADIPLRFGKRQFHATARQLGFHVYTANPLRVAYNVGRVARSGPRDIPVVTRFAGPGLRRYVDYLSHTFGRTPVNAALHLVGSSPQLVADTWGRKVDQAATVRALTASLRNPARPVATVAWHALKPAVTRRDVGMAIVIDRNAHHLTLYHGSALVRSFGVAVGQPAYPTPSGSFRILDKQMNPWWYPPDSDWAKGEKPVPPGPGNPLGTRWMDLGNGVGIHGTPDAASIGYSASHGCIRMQIPDAEWLFTQISVGTPVWIL